MRKWKSSSILFLVTCCVLIAGCSTGDPDGTTSPEVSLRNSGQAEQHTLWGLWSFHADPVMQTLEAFELRTGFFHANVLPFLEPPPLLHLSIDSIEFNGNLIDAVIGLRHPFLGLTEFTGFDVCGILISNGSVSGFQDPALIMTGDGDTRILNPDGLTRWWNPAEFPNDGTMFGYIDGLLGAPDSFANYNSTLNGYKYFCDDLALNDDMDMIDPTGRGMFTPGQKNSRLYQLELGAEGLIFNYAVDACWEFPSGDPPWLAPDDFGPGANRPEPYRISVSEIDKTLIYDPNLGEAAGEVTLLIDVYDWFNPHLNTILVESGDVFTPLSTNAPIGGGVGYSTYQLDILDAQPLTAGMIDLLITCESDESGYQEFIPGAIVSSYFIYAMEIPEGEINTGFPCGELYTEENFDSYYDGQYPLPSPWTIFWSGNPSQCRVTSEQYYSAPHAWRAADYASWARHDGIPMTKQSHFCYEMQVMLTNVNYPARFGFAWKKTSSTTGYFAAYGIGGVNYNTYQWYHVYSEIDTVNNNWKLWIDDELKVDSNYTDETGENSFTHLIIGTTNHSGYYGIQPVYFDDVRLWVDP